MEGITELQFYFMSMLSSICLVLLIFTAMSRSLRRSRRALLLCMEIASVALMFFERGGYYFEGDTSRLGIVMLQISDFMSYVMPYVLTLFYVAFVYDYMKEEEGLTVFPKTLAIIQTLNVVGIVSVILAECFHLFYYIDSSNHYHRTDYYTLSYIIPVFIFPLLFYSVFHNGKKLRTRQKLLLLLYCIIPFFAVSLQPFLYGLSLINISMVLPIILIFVVHLGQMDRKARDAKDLEIRTLSEQQNKTQKKLNQSYEDLMRALEDANAANVAKTRFLSNISHDIRTPLNAIVGYTEIALRHEKDAARVNDCLAKINVASEQLTNLISDVLDMTAIEEGTFKFKEDTVSLQAAVNNIVSMFSTTLEKKNLELAVNLEAEHDKVTCDPNFINRILMNVISNSVKFTGENGTISLSVEEGKEFTKDGKRNYRFTITDNGIGMTEDFLERIYEPFEKAQSATISQQQGSGLGMAIVKNLVDHLKGTISITSRLGVGTTTVIDIPLKKAAEERGEMKEIGEFIPGSMEGRTILLVDDMPINREIACMILTEQKIKIEQAENGLEAVERYKKYPDRYDAILMDIQMPVMNGLEATASIRSLEESGERRVPIIAMTADAFAEDRLKAIYAGMDDHIAKPIDHAKLFGTLSKYLQ